MQKLRFVLVKLHVVGYTVFKLKKEGDRMKVDGNKLKGLIRARGYTYRSLTESLKEQGFNIDQSTVNNVANNNNNPTLPTIQILYHGLNMTPEEGAEIFFRNKLHKTGNQ